MSGLLPVTIDYLITYVASHAAGLLGLLPSQEDEGGDPVSLSFALMNAVLTSPEFASKKATRFLPYGFDTPVTNSRVTLLQPLLAEPRWQAYRAAANASGLLLEWLDGTPLGRLEGRFEAVRAGNIQAASSEVAWVLTGLANVLAAATRANLSPAERPTPLRTMSQTDLNESRLLIGSARLLAWRLNVGLSPECLWLTELRTSTGARVVSRPEVLALSKYGLSDYNALRKRENWGDLIKAMASTGNVNAQHRAKVVQDGANGWHSTVRARRMERQVYGLQAPVAEAVKDFYNSWEKEYELKLESLLKLAGVEFELFDDGTRPGSFDYLVSFSGRAPLALECKSKPGGGLVDLNAARVVLASTEQYGHGDKFCTTLCQPGIDPNVLSQLQSCSRLSIVETHDFAEGIIRLIKGVITQEGLYDWLAQPGQARMEGL